MPEWELRLVIFTTAILAEFRIFVVNSLCGYMAASQEHSRGDHGSGLIIFGLLLKISLLTHS